MALNLALSMIFQLFTLNMPSYHRMPRVRSYFKRHPINYPKRLFVAPQETASCLQPVYDRVKLMDVLDH